MIRHLYLRYYEIEVQNSNRLWDITSHKINIDIRIPPTNQDQSHFASWQRQFIQTLRMNQGTDSYLDSHIIWPNKDSEPCAYSNWHVNNGSILDFMGLVIDEAEQEVIENAATAEEAWKLLTQRHAQEAQSSRYNLSRRLLTFVILQQRSIPPHLPNLQLSISGFGTWLCTTWENVAQSLAQSDGTNPDLKANPTAKKYDSSDIKRVLDMAQGLVDSDAKTTDIVLSSQTSPKSNSCTRPNSPKCTNPKCTKPIGHTREWCISPGGGMAGKTIEESKEACLKDCEKRKGGNKLGETNKPNYQVVESNGHAYIIDIDNNTASMLLLPVPP
ncbi:hypothetical protein D9758_011643 [Tetrapyrgos nigripes]|uniref:Uncharacterized protein n=1 Tax=Tetrapyrgos nigripes TaxID=182062 RepID=A0A8H5CSH4_9AGAR|nr:hypothetical protein D9758_011643 [Tetrapyrgos nigripes]